MNEERGKPMSTIRMLKIWLAALLLPVLAACGTGEAGDAGATSKEVATALCISENTVKNHLRNILEKLHLANRVQAAALPLRRGLIPPPKE